MKAFTYKGFFLYNIISTKLFGDKNIQEKDEKMAEKKYVYAFKEAHEAHLGKDILGGKGNGLAAPESSQASFDTLHTLPCLSGSSGPYQALPCGRGSSGTTTQSYA